MVASSGALGVSLVGTAALRNTFVALTGSTGAAIRLDASARPANPTPQPRLLGVTARSPVDALRVETDGVDPQDITITNSVFAGAVRVSATTTSGTAGTLTLRGDRSAYPAGSPVVTGPVAQEQTGSIAFSRWHAERRGNAHGRGTADRRRDRRAEPRPDRSRGQAPQSWGRLRTSEHSNVKTGRVPRHPPTLAAGRRGEDRSMRSVARGPTPSSRCSISRARSQSSPIQTGEGPHDHRDERRAGRRQARVADHDEAQGQDHRAGDRERRRAVGARW